MVATWWVAGRRAERGRGRGEFLGCRTAAASVSRLLQESDLWVLLSDEGPIAVPRYTVPTPVDGEHEQQAPDGSLLLPNYPNPFNPSTTIRVELATASRVKLSVVSLQGEIVSVLADGLLGPGSHRYAWDGTGRSSGVYFCRMERSAAADGTTTFETRRMVLLR